MKRWWISWEHGENFGGFETPNTPWWWSGGGFYHENICAAVLAESEEAARQAVYNFYDEPPEEIRFRFVTEKPDDWSPYTDRFPKADWMQWPSDDDTSIKATVWYWVKMNTAEGYKHKEEVQVNLNDLIKLLESHNVMLREKDGAYTLFIDEKKWLFKQR